MLTSTSSDIQDDQLHIRADHHSSIEHSARFCVIQNSGVVQLFGDCRRRDNRFQLWYCKALYEETRIKFYQNSNIININKNISVIEKCMISPLLEYAKIITFLAV